jgi:hypothetical protein
MVICFGSVENPKPEGLRHVRPLLPLRLWFWTILQNLFCIKSFILLMFIRFPTWGVLIGLWNFVTANNFPLLCTCARFWSSVHSYMWSTEDSAHPIKDTHHSKQKNSNLSQVLFVHNYVLCFNTVYIPTYEFRATTNSQVMNALLWQHWERALRLLWSVGPILYTWSSSWPHCTVGHDCM